MQYDDQLVLLVGDTAHLLAGLGVVTWLALAAPQNDGERPGRGARLTARLRVGRTPVTCDP